MLPTISGGRQQASHCSSCSSLSGDHAKVADPDDIEVRPYRDRKALGEAEAEAVLAPSEDVKLRRHLVRPECAIEADRVLRADSGIVISMQQEGRWHIGSYLL